MNDMKILVVGSGGREHALAWKLHLSRRLGDLFVAPGDAGTSMIAKNVPIKATDIWGLLHFAKKNDIDLTIVGPDEPLALGIADVFMANGLRIFGPTKAAAQIESSKAFSKQLMRVCGVPTSPFNVYIDYAAASDKVRFHFENRAGLSIVVKASGLTQGKGAYVCHELAEAELALDDIMKKQIYGAAGDTVIIEDFVDGPEVSLHAFCDGKSFSLFPESQDHKPIFAGGKGSNTGGMGAVAPVPYFKHADVIGEKVIVPILNKLRGKGMPFSGVIYPGIKMSERGPMVLEYNDRFGDPETQVYMRLLKTDLVDILEACVDGRLHEINIEWGYGYAVCVVMASARYPSRDYERGKTITGIEDAEKLPGVVVFHAGTNHVDGQLVTSGGRVLGVTAIGATLDHAIHMAYIGVKCIHFEGAQYRSDIGAQALRGIG